MRAATKSIDSLGAMEWGAFFIDDIAIISSGKRLTKSDMKSGVTPFIGASDSNNGVTAFISNTNASEDSNVLGVNYDGSVAENFYHPYRAIFSDSVKRLSLKGVQGSKYLYLFLKNSILKQKTKYQYAYKLNEARLKRQKVMLPISKGACPDWQFMDRYSRTFAERKISAYKKYAETVLAQLQHRDIERLENKRWADFFIEDIATISSGRDIYDAERVLGDIPYISSTSKDNGIGHFVGNSNLTLESECLSVNRNGSVGYSFYHPYKGLFSNDCRKLKLKGGNGFAGRFIANQITMQREKYNYGYKMGTARLKRQKIMLPISEDGKPDWQFMEQYIKNLYCKKLKEYLDYLLTSKTAA